MRCIITMTALLIHNNYFPQTYIFQAHRSHYRPRHSSSPPPLHPLRNAMWSIKLYVQPHENRHYKNSHCVCVFVCSADLMSDESSAHPLLLASFCHISFAHTHTRKNNTRCENVPRRSPYFHRMGNKGPSRRFLL